MALESDHIIHSGHFMVSSLNDEDEAELPGSYIGAKSRTELVGKRGYNFDKANMKLSHTYLFGSRSTDILSLDPSLAKMFECMTLAYSGKLVSPKWKNFRGIDVKLKDKVRLNNIIWREWHMQYIQRKKPIVCQFETPVSDRTHAKPEAVVMEGKYWKRRLQCVTNEYIKWRRYFKDHLVPVSDGQVNCLSDMPDRVTTCIRGRFGADAMQLDISAPDNYLIREDDYCMDFSDTLFSSLNQPLVFPDPREFAQLGFADLIQPGLIQLQPNFDDVTDTVDEQLLCTTSLSCSSAPSGCFQPATVTDVLSNMQHELQDFFDFNSTSSRNTSVSTCIETMSMDVDHKTVCKNVCSPAQNIHLSADIKKSIEHCKLLIGNDKDIHLEAFRTVSTTGCSVSLINSHNHKSRFQGDQENVRDIDSSAVGKPMGLSTTALYNCSTQNAGTFSNERTLLETLLTHGSTSSQAVSSAGSNKCSTSGLLKPEMNDFHKNMLIAAASQAVGISRDSVEASTLFHNILDNGASVKSTVYSQQALANKEEAVGSENFRNSSAVASNGEFKMQHTNHTKSVHQTAEYRRRCNIKNSFDLLNRLVPALLEAGGGKVNKATTLMKAAEFCGRLKREREESMKEMEALREEIISLQADISCYQAQLPAGGAPSARSVHQSSQMTALYEAYVRGRTLSNWKFWIFSLIIRSLFCSFNATTMNSSNFDELCRGVLAWLEQNCSLIALRPVVLGSLRDLSTTTSILTDPTVVPRQAAEAVQN